MAHPLQVTLVADREVHDSIHTQLPGALSSATPFPGTLADATTLGVDSSVDLALVEWDPLRAPLFGAVCARYRDVGRPVVALCESREDGPAAVLAGADTVVLAPYPVREFQAVVVSHQRTAAGAVGVRSDVMEVGPLRIDDRRKRVVAGEVELVLTTRLYDLLVYLVRRAGEVVTRDDLLAGVWGLDFDPSTNTVDVYVHYLRRALRPVGLEGAVVTVRGRGYVFEVPEE